MITDAVIQLWLERLPQIKRERDAENFELALVLCGDVTKEETVEAREMGVRIGEA